MKHATVLLHVRDEVKGQCREQVLEGLVREKDDACEVAALLTLPWTDMKRDEVRRLLLEAQKVVAEMASLIYEYTYSCLLRVLSTSTRAQYSE